MEELEDPTERLKETMEAAEEKREQWTLHVALTTAVIAVLAAIAGLLGNHHANESMLEQIKSADQWAFYQSKSIKWEINNSTAQVLAAMGKPLPPENTQKAKQLEDDKAKIMDDAKEAEKASQSEMRQHIVFSGAVTIFQIAIAISAIAIVTRKKLMWYISLLLSAGGCIFLIVGFLTR